MSGLPSLTILSEEQKFNGDNLLQWNTNLTQLLGSKGLSGYIDGAIPKPEKPKPTDSTAATITSTPVYSTTPSFDEWMFRDQLARGHVTLNCTDVASLGVVTTGTAKEAWDSIQAEWGKSTDMRRSHAQEALNRTIYAEGTSIQDHIKLLRSRKVAVDNLCTSPMTDETWKGIIIRSIPPTAKWLPVIPSLYALSTPADIVSTLSTHGMILESLQPTRSANTALAAHTHDHEGCTNPNCKAKKRSTHKTIDCYWPGGGKEGQFPPNFRHKSKANTANSSTTDQPQVEHHALSARLPNTPGQSGILIDEAPDLDPINYSSTALITKAYRGSDKGGALTYMDSGASDTMFISRDSFSDYKSIEPRLGDSAKAVDGGFEIIGEGSVVQRYQVDGKEKNITYTRALHAPSLSANLVSVSSLDAAGLTTTFGQGRGVTRKPDGTVVLAGRMTNGMYILDPIDTNSLNTTTAMTSLSQSTPLEQWHRRFTHCSPLTIQDMADKNLVDGLKISEMTLTGKCEDCILGRQTRRPFDGTTEKDMPPLHLVSFDLWGPSRVPSIGGKTFLMIIVDAGTSVKHGDYLPNKSDDTTITAFEAFRAKAEITTGKKICRLRTDGAFHSAAWKEYTLKHGITHEPTAPYSSAQNGLAERAIRTTMEDVRTLLSDSGLAHSYWAEASAYSIDTRNLIPSRRHPGRIPLESFTGKRQSVAHLRVFGAKCWAKIPTLHGVQVTGGSKLDPRSIECRLLGYASGNGNYRVQDVSTRRVYVSRDVVFEEGNPHRTSASVGEQIPLFETDFPLTATPITEATSNNNQLNPDDQNPVDLPNQ
jgi:hypothetical protein